MKKFFRKLLKWVLALLVIFGGLYLARKPILRGIGNFLIHEDTLQPVDATFVLSGGVIERTEEAARMFPEHTPVIYATGANRSGALQAMGINLTDAEVGRKVLWDLGVDSAAVKVIQRGTSTYEESEEILGFASAEGLKRIMIISSKFHTRRVSSVFRRKFRSLGIEVIVRGAPPATYDTQQWWQHEESLIFVFNEYAKLLYYAWKY
ncbi:MAG: YdcF family protein [Bacteroidota bacterium]